MSQMNTLKWLWKDSWSFEELSQIVGILWLIVLTIPLGCEKLGNP